MNRYTNDPRRSFTVHGATYRRQLEAQRQKAAEPDDPFAGVLAGIAVLAFGWAVGFGIAVWFV